MTDLKTQYENIREEIDSSLKGVLSLGDFILGKEVNILEKEIAKYLGVKYAYGVASGTDALVLALTALGIGEGDEVLTTPFTFIATAESICRVGAKPVFCDIEYDSYNISPDRIEEKINAQTKAIIPVHLYGLSCEMDRICALAKKYNLRIVEDCAQSFGSEYKGKKTGAFGDCATLSFYPAKTLGCYGDGGMVVTNDPEAAEKIERLRNHGSVNKYYYHLHGFNSRLDTLQAAVLRVKLKHVDLWITERIEHALRYSELLAGINGISVPAPHNECKHSFNYYTIRVKNNNREAMQNKLKEKGISSAIFYPLCLHLQEVYKKFNYQLGDFPTAEAAQKQVLSLPMYPELTKTQIQETADTIKTFLSSVEMNFSV